MRRLVPLAALAVLVAACGKSSPTVVSERPTDLGPPTREAAKSAHAIPTQRGYRPRFGNTERARFYGAGGCGVERWAVKTLTDPSAGQVDLEPQGTWVGDLVSIAPPLDPTDRVAPTETHAFRLTASLIYVKAEGDGDYHLVVEDSAGDTMIVESTDPRCAVGSRVEAQIEGVRAAIDRRFPSLPSGRIEPGIGVTVTGVGFFDRVHGQTGVAPNGVELHPLLGIDFGTATAVPATKLRPSQRGVD